MEKKLKHLEMLQTVISRMAKCSFLLKGWNVVLVSAIFAVASGESKSQLVYFAYLPATAFWLLDGYFLRQERMFRALYDKVRPMAEDDIDFSMNTTVVASKVASWLAVTWSITLCLFHGVILLTITAAWLLPVILRFCRGMGQG